MEKRRRLVRAADYARVHSGGKSWALPLLVVRVLRSGQETTRFGFSVGKRVGKAVVRNRVKRLLREVARSVIVKSGWDIVIIARAPSASASFQEIRAAVLGALRRARLLAEGSPREG
ncbi:MAG: ribonuclease P protein component [Dehalococcoidia bacterium]|nr:ribonuclease P protein component [Dehalococcoidia bacterium]